MTKKDMEARRTALRRFLSAEYDPDTVMLDGPEFDGGIVGVASVPAGQGTRRCRLVYSYMKLAAALAASIGWSWNDAVEWIEYNTIRSLPYLGDRAPIVMNDLDPDEFAPRKREDAE